MKIENCSGIYRIRNITTNDVYIGSTTRFSKRWRAHYVDLVRGTHHSKYLQRVWNKYGSHNLKYEILLLCEPKDLLFYEQLMLDLYKPVYNSQIVAGSNLGIKQSKETIEKRIAKTRLIPRTPEWCANISKGNKGKKLSPEHIQKLKDRKVSDETRKKLSESHKGQVLSPLAKERARMANIGRQISEETRLKMSESAKIVAAKRPPQTLESRRKRSESMRKTCAEKRLTKEAYENTIMWT